MAILSFDNVKEVFEHLKNKFNNNNNFLILENFYEVKKLYDFILGEKSDIDILILPEFEEIENHFKSKNQIDITEIYKCLIKISKTKNNLVILPKSFLDKKIIKKENILDSQIKIKKNEEFNLDKLSKNLVDLNYLKVDTVFDRGEFSKRGDVLDIFPWDLEYPIRLSFLFNTVEKITEFNVTSQESFKENNEFTIYSNKVSIEGDSCLESYISSKDNIFSTSSNRLKDKNNFTLISIKNKSTKLIREISKEVDSTINIIEENDYVVHEQYGICKFLGVKTRDTDYGKRDYLLLLFFGGDTLYVPVENSSVVKKYISYSSDIDVVLSKRSSALFLRKKEKIREEIRKTAGELLKIYAKRKLTKREPYELDLAKIKDFEDGFSYLETVDQINAIKNIKEDLTNDYPMDRLILGDVGYGKTEVAIRAIFIALSNYKQVAFLCPTTILSKQHYNTLLERFKELPFNIKLLSSKTTSAESKKIKEDLKEGKIDLIIGTHSLISKSVSFKDLGLVIIDEEQKFGVFQKENFKKRTPNVDFLSLSATPIPRTLGMSLSGIYDYDLIMTPPDSRLPIKTYFSKINFELVRVAIDNELKRGGQVFLITYRKNLLEFYKKKLCEFYSEDKIGIIHGGGDSSESIYLDFLERKVDILIGTTILESGLDIPTLNTIIILNAEHFGLGILHQLRGRVGRSYEQGYCFLFYKDDETLSELAKSRIKAIEKFSLHGAGFKIANKDMENRGSGNFLGKAQSGHILEVGHELYNELLKDEIDKLKGQSDEERNIKETVIKLPINYLIPEDYITDYEMRVYTYSLISKIETKDELKVIKEKLEDRFGKIPSEAENLLYVSFIKNLAKRKRIEVVDERFIKGVYKNDLDLLNNVRENINVEI